MANQCPQRSRMMLEDLKPEQPAAMGNRVLYPRQRRPLTAINQPVIGGTPITMETAVGLRETLFGSCTHVGSHEWLKASFHFREPNSVFSYGLVAPKNSVKPILMCVQAYILKNLLFPTVSKKNTRKVSANERVILYPSMEKQNEALRFALADIVWKAGVEKSKCMICLRVNESYVQKDNHYTPDGVTEKLRMFEFAQYEDVISCLSKYQYLFQQESGHGVLMLLYSTLLSRGLDRIHEDLGREYSQLLTPLGECSQALITLLITGRATPFLHNGVIHFGGVDTVAKPQVGITGRSEIGFLVWRRNHDLCSQLGSRLKTPTFPIWVTCVDDQYGVLFNPNRDLTRDHRAEHRFDLHYYNSAPYQTEPTIISLDTRFNKSQEEYGTPPLECLILTKWQGATVNWNGTSPVA
ncbi:inactive ubiquitin carboxyl-terminal hydrolase MINDY-4B-like isoform X1 [Tachypleus tridentatus]|uniref:inactive ubiquitin carboxyl-terminal hydrolase MINDY-4B-like isoform X1 n=1 Tax=Tachypleus tridentatus TaxID=6853 RepID=UPI003FCFA3FC